MSLIKLEPIFQERLWGGRNLESLFGYDIPEGKVGECWGISAHPNGITKVAEGKFKGQTLQQLWASYRDELFGTYTMEEFPLLVKILDAQEPLSVQVHPNNQQALELEGEAYGKTECWYVLKAAPEAELILGHSAQTPAEMREMINNNQWDTLLQRQPVKNGDFIFVESGTIHAIGAGIVILETQQSSDTTYRVYDYDRMDNNGEKRELHLEKAMHVTNFPGVSSISSKVSKCNRDGVVTTLVQTEEFHVFHHEVFGNNYNPNFNGQFYLLTIIEGEGYLSLEDSMIKLCKGDHYIIPKGVSNITASGNMEWITSTIPQDY
ncbi:mannose-6-phosphate isomerase, class I [Priestia megaterium]|uniref:mannose-6-phosphate isomerase, class I n=1 Tax=Priestia megaterium TaxID=1404 RepID=UPI003008E813